MSDNAKIGFAGGFVLILIGAGLLFGMWGCPQYRVYEQRMEGEAKLKESEGSRQIAVEEAKAKYESAKLLSQAEVERAKGVAEANRIIGDSLKENREYLIYLWIQELNNNPNNVIYVPTETGLPVLEAGRFLKQIDEKRGKEQKESKD